MLLEILKSNRMQFKRKIAARKTDALTLTLILKLFMLFRCSRAAFTSPFSRKHGARFSICRGVSGIQHPLVPGSRRDQYFSAPTLSCKLHFSGTRGYTTMLTSTNTNEEFDEINVLQHETGTGYDVILKGLNPAQAQAVTQPLESITRVVAGPGAGKTRVLICRIAYLLKRDNEDKAGKKNSRILAVTFTKKAASEMQHRLDTMLREDEDYQNKLAASRVSEKNQEEDDDIYEEVVGSDNSVDRSADFSSSMITRVSLGTFHSICAKILRWNGSELGKLPSIQHYKPKGTEGDILDSSFAIVDQSEQMRIVKQCLTDAGIDLKGSGKGQTDIRPITILNAVGQLKSDDAMETDSRPSGRDEPSSGIKMTSKVRRIAEEVYPLYRTALLSQNSVDFDDLILLTRELLKTNEEVRDRMSNRWQHILVDEFQDTSEVQLDLVKLLARDSLLIVGDGDQSIYSWRGAHVESMTDFVQKFDKAGEKKVDTVYLMENYRLVLFFVLMLSLKVSGNAALHLTCTRPCL